MEAPINIPYRQQPQMMPYSMPPAPLIKKVQNYSFNMGDVVGKGNFSTVYKAINELTNQIVAIKVVELSSIKTPALVDLLYSEIEILKTLKHPNILNCIEIFSSPNNCYIITELCDGDVESKIRSAGSLDQKEARRIFYDVYQGLKYLNEQRIVHRDFKCANIFMKAGSCKIADFGFAKRTTQNFKDINIGSPIYMAPEGLLENIYGPKTDVWGFGIFLYEVLHGQTPLSFCKTEQELQFHIVKPFSPEKIKPHISMDLKDLICRCLQIDERRRISVKEIQNHPYFLRIYRELGKDTSGSAATVTNNTIFSSSKSYGRSDDLLSPQPIIDFSRNNTTPQQPQPETRLAGIMRGISLQVPTDQYQLRGLSPMESRNTPDMVDRRRGVSRDRGDRAPPNRMTTGNNMLTPPPNSASTNNSYTSINSPAIANGSQSMNAYSNTSLSANKRKESSQIITSVIRFPECVHLLHYCRLLYKTIGYLQKQLRLTTNRIIEVYTNWLLDLLEQINSKIPFYVKFEGEKAALREKKLKQVVTEYYTKYNKELLRKPGVQGSLQHTQSMSIKFLQYLDGQLRGQYLDQDTAMLANYVYFIIEVNKLLQKCVINKEFTSFLKECNIQNFLNLKKESFDAASYAAVRKKLNTLIHQ